MVVQTLEVIHRFIIIAFFCCVSFDQKWYQAIAITVMTGKS